jgi:hypothetical protein
MGAVAVKSERLHSQNPLILLHWSGNARFSDPQPTPLFLLSSSQWLVREEQPLGVLANLPQRLVPYEEQPPWLLQQQVLDDLLALLLYHWVLCEEQPSCNYCKELFSHWQTESVEDAREIGWDDEWY